MNPEPLDLDDEFEDFMRSVNPAVAEYEMQYKESRRCFFAGAASIFFYIAYSAALWGDEKALEAMQRLEQQLREFALQVKSEQR